MPIVNAAMEGRARCCGDREEANLTQAGVGMKGAGFAEGDLEPVLKDW